MNSKSLYLAVASVLFAVSAILIHNFVNSRATSVTSSSVRSLDITPSGEFIDLVSSDSYFQEQLVRNPDVVQNYTGLAQLRLQQATLTGEEALYLSDAQRLLAEALDRDPADYHARVLNVRLLNSLHRFDDALPLARKLIQERPFHAYNYGSAIDALIELGRYVDAVSLSDSLMNLRPGLPAYARAAYLRQLLGDLEGAMDAMVLAANSGSRGSTERAWCLDQLGQMFLMTGEIDKAEEIFESILIEKPDYGRLASAFASTELARGNFDAALELIVPDNQSESLDLELELEVRTLQSDSSGIARIQSELETTYLKLEAAGENIDMEYADFLVDNGGSLSDAHERIRNELDRRPEHLHVLETYAWVLHHMDRSTEATKYIDQALRFDTYDAMVNYRAAQIYSGAGKTHRALELVKLAIDQHLAMESPSAYREALAFQNELQERV